MAARKTTSRAKPVTVAQQAAREAARLVLGEVQRINARVGTPHGAAAAQTQAQTQAQMPAAKILGDYPAARETRTRRGRRPMGGSPNFHADKTTRDNLRRDAQSFGRGNPDARAIAKRLADMLVGDGLVVRSRATDKQWADTATDLFNQWMDSRRPDAMGRRTGWQLLYAAMKVPVLEGDGLFVKLATRDGLKLQWIEAERIVNKDLGGDTSDMIGGCEIRNGEIVAYHVAEWNIGQSGTIGSTRGIPARNTIYVGNIADDAMNQVRSVPMIQACVESLGLVEDVERNSAISVAIATLFAVLIKSENPLDTKEGMEAELAQSEEQQSGGPVALTLEPGVIKHMQTGDSAEQIKPEHPTMNVMDFNQRLVAKAAADIGLSRALTHMDLSGMTASNAKALLAIVGRTLEHQASQPVLIVRELFIAFVALAIVRGELPMTDQWDRVDVVAKNVPLPDLEAEIRAAVAAIDNNFSTSERETERLGMGRFEAIVRQRGEEVKMEAAAGVPRVLKPGAGGAAEAPQSTDGKAQNTNDAALN